MLSHPAGFEHRPGVNASPDFDVHTNPVPLLILGGNGRVLGCPRWLLNICLAYYMFSPFINIVSARLSHLAKHVYHPYATMFRAFVTMVR